MWVPRHTFIPVVVCYVCSVCSVGRPWHGRWGHGDDGEGKAREGENEDGQPYWCGTCVGTTWDGAYLVSSYTSDRGFRTHREVFRVCVAGSVAWCFYTVDRGTCGYPPPPPPPPHDGGKWYYKIVTKSKKEAKNSLSESWGCF